MKPTIRAGDVKLGEIAIINAQRGEKIFERDGQSIFLMLSETGVPTNSTFVCDQEFLLLVPALPGVLVDGEPVYVGDIVYYLSPFNPPSTMKYSMRVTGINPNDVYGLIGEVIEHTSRLNCVGEQYCAPARFLSKTDPRIKKETEVKELTSNLDSMIFSDGAIWKVVDEKFFIDNIGKDLFHLKRCSDSSLFTIQKFTLNQIKGYLSGVTAEFVGFKR